MALLKWRPEVQLPAESAVDFVSLRVVKLFADLKENDAALRVLWDLMHVENFATGHMIVKEGESGDELFILLEGAVSIFKATPQGDRYKVADLQGSKGIFFGEGGLLDAESRSATIEASAPCKCLVLNRDAFASFCTEHPAWAISVVMHIARLVNGRLRRTNQDLLLLYNALVAEIQGS